MSIGAEPVDDSGRNLTGWDATSHAPAVPQISGTSVDAAGVRYGSMSITGSITASNPSVGTDGSAAPTSSTQIGGSDGTNLQPLQVDGSNNLKMVEKNSAAILADVAHIPAQGTAAMAGSTPVTIATNDTNFSELLTDTDNLANIPAKGTAVMTGSTPVTIATNDTVFAELLGDTDNLATIVTNTNKLIAPSVNAGNRDATTQRVRQAGNGTATVTQVASSASSGQILAANTNKEGTLFFNDSTAILYLLYGAGTASTSNYSVQVGAKQYFEDPLHFTGIFTGIWASANGNVYCTEVA